MTQVFSEFSTDALLKVGNEELLQNYSTSQAVGLYTFIWATHHPAELIVDGVPVTLQAHQILTLTAIQFLEYVSGDDLIVYQFNREFYCIKDHDQEVGCVGLLFFGNTHIPIVSLDTLEQPKFNMLHQVFLDELETIDNIQAEMLRMLMARFIIKTTRLLKSNSENDTPSKSPNDLLRHYNLLVETHYKEAHNVSFYADKLFKSPKTLSNTFAKYEHSPLQIIHDRLVLETKRQLLYTDRSAKEIAYDIGFDDASHLSRLFKKQTGLTPSAFRKQQQTAA